jgi:hypothetical protein
MWKRRTLEIVGQLFIGDGLTALLVPRGHMRLWQDAIPARSWRHLAQWFAERPGAARAQGLFSLTIGVWIVAKASRGLAGDEA